MKKPESLSQTWALSRVFYMENRVCYIKMKKKKTYCLKKSFENLQIFWFIHG